MYNANVPIDANFHNSRWTVETRMKEVAFFTQVAAGRCDKVPANGGPLLLVLCTLVWVIKAAGFPKSTAACCSDVFAEDSLARGVVCIGVLACGVKKVAFFS